MTPPGDTHLTIRRATFAGLILLNLVLTVLYTRADLLTNDDFYADPGHLYPRDGRWAVIPVLGFVDEAFASQHVAKPLAWVVLAVMAAALATHVATLVARSTVHLVGVALIVSLGLMASPNMMWGPGLWYNAIAFAWVTLALVAITRALSADTRRGRLVGSLLWLVGTVGAALSYQPFAIIPVLLWLVLAPSTASTPRVLLRSIALPALAVVATALLTAVFSVLIPSSRLESGVGEGLSPDFSLGVELLSYGRPAQIALLWAIAILGVASVVVVSQRRGIPGSVLSTTLTLGASALVIAVPPLLLPEARLERFASTVEVSVLIGLIALVSHLSTHLAENPPPSSSRIALFLGVSTALAAAILGVAGYGVAAATLGVVLALSLMLSLLVWVVGLPRSGEVWVGITVLASLLVSQAMVREQLFDNWLSTGLDREVASEIALEMSRLELSTTEVVQVNFGVVGQAPWYSPLLRLSVAGPDVLEQYLSSLNSFDVDVRAATELCRAESDERVVVTPVSATEVTVCVFVD